MTLFRSLLLVAALLVPAAATAAPIAYYSASGSAQFDGQFADFFDDGTDDIDISVTAEVVGSTFTGSLLVSDLSGVLLESASIFDVMLDLQPGTDTATVFFDMLSGPAASLFNGVVKAVFTFSLEDEDNGVFDPVGVTLYGEPAVIPLPASVAFLVLGLGALAGLKRRRA